ncbi:hypothetical protein SteCoe_2805 [Stentor coeruleus]|uniref:Uncharacterized protein n=1 Tax=Stentor coeruleus TaxID=5963 RepID=A0A1R2CYG5_9CILI|nr:hypothetical protein SteCoe_2805 [Stentor coeruleus]
MKSNEISIIRSEGIEEDPIDCTISLGDNIYGIVNLKPSQGPSPFYLPLTGVLGIELKHKNKKIGEIYVDLNCLERDGLQWLPILCPGSEKLLSIPDEVAEPRILISLNESKSKYPDMPMARPLNTMVSAILQLAGQGSRKFEYENIEKPSSVRSHSNSMVCVKKIDIDSIDKTLSKSLMSPCQGFPRKSKSEGTESVFYKSTSKNTLDLPKKIEFDNSDKHIPLAVSSGQASYKKFDFELAEKALENVINSSIQDDLAYQVVESPHFPAPVPILEKKPDKELNDKKVFPYLHGSPYNNCKKFDFESTENREKNLIIEKLKQSVKETEDFYEEVIEKLKNDVSKMQKKNYLKKKNIKKQCIEIEMLKRKIKALEGEKSADETQMWKKQCETLKGSIKDIERAKEKLENELQTLKNLSITCEHCKAYKKSIKENSKALEEYKMNIEMLMEKVNTQEFHNQELLIYNQDLENSLCVAEKKITCMKNYEGLELYSNNVQNDEIDEKLEAKYQRFKQKSVKICRGLYVYEGKKVQVIDKIGGVTFLLDGKDTVIMETQDNSINKTEKNLPNLEDISNQIDNYKPQNLIHGRGTSRENKLRVLAKQW